ncbi:MAG: DUF4878 domain-containing protein [Paludibacter sp.]|jgi:hypothetical protein|nr:DUF4878 domain-containing protein [Paludibacter sp.]
MNKLTIKTTTNADNSNKTKNVRVICDVRGKGKATFFLAGAIIAFLAVNCIGSSANSPAAIEKSMYIEFQKGNYDKGVEILIANLDSNNSSSSDETSESEMAESIKTLAEKNKNNYEEKGGLKSFEILKETISEDGQTATVESKVLYGNGSEDTNTSAYVKRNGVWKVSLGK